MEEHCNIIQEQLDDVEDWNDRKGVKQYKMQGHLERRTTKLVSYQLDVKVERELGIILNHKMMLGYHCDVTMKETNKILGFTRHNISSKDREILMT